MKIRTLFILWLLARRAGIAFVGGSVLVVGLLMIILPGPAVLVVPAGLGILALEFAWARRLRDRVRQAASDGAARLGRRLGGARARRA